MKNTESIFIEQSSALDSYLTTLLSDNVGEETIQPDAEVESESLKEEAPAVENRLPNTSIDDPDRSQTCFEVLPFSVDNLELAAIMDDVAGTADMVGKLRPVSSQPDWVMGLAECQGRKIAIIDSALLIVGSNSNGSSGSGKRDYKKILLLKNAAWGIAVDDVGKNYPVESLEIRWRTKKKSRPWLLGTLVDRLCALVDVNLLVP